jgi:hypothetical protein
MGDFAFDNGLDITLVFFVLVSDAPVSSSWEKNRQKEYSSN